MGAVPKRKISTHRKGKRRRNKKLSTTGLIKCNFCNELKLPHQACGECGAYKKG